MIGSFDRQVREILKGVFLPPALAANALDIDSRISNGFKSPLLIGKTYCLPPIKLTLPMFRVTGYEGEKFLSAVPPPR